MYAMLEAEFGLSPDWIDENMDLPRFDGHLRYRSFNPPIGALFKAFMDSFGGDGNKTEIVYGGGYQRPKENTEEDFLEAFGALGGVIVNKTGGEKNG
jgi:hypothetical protein